jgi:hypothetical protein
MDSFSSGYAPRTTSHKNSNKPSASTKGMEVLSYMRLTSPQKPTSEISVTEWGNVYKWLTGAMVHPTLGTRNM